MKKPTVSGPLLASVVALVGCTDPIVGDWEGDGGGVSLDNELSLYDDGTGEATIYYSFEGDSSVYHTEFEISWRAAASGDYELEMECDGTCADENFTMECEMNDAEDKMDCEGDKIWSEYSFEWALIE